MTNVLIEAKWWETHDNLVTLTQYLADEGNSAHFLADAVEKPWNFSQEFVAAVLSQFENQFLFENPEQSPGVFCHCFDCEGKKWTDFDSLHAHLVEVLGDGRSLNITGQEDE